MIVQVTLLHLGTLGRSSGSRSELCCMCGILIFFFFGKHREVGSLPAMRITCIVTSGVSFWLWPPKNKAKQRSTQKQHKGARQEGDRRTKLNAETRDPPSSWDTRPPHHASRARVQTEHSPLRTILRGFWKMLQKAWWSNRPQLVWRNGWQSRMVLRASLQSPHKSPRRTLGGMILISVMMKLRITGPTSLGAQRALEFPIPSQAGSSSSTGFSAKCWYGCQCLVTRCSMPP